MMVYRHSYTDGTPPWILYTDLSNGELAHIIGMSKSGGLKTHANVTLENIREQAELILYARSIGAL